MKYLTPVEVLLELLIIVETAKEWIYAITVLQIMCSQRKTAKTVHRLKYSHLWDRIKTGFDASRSDKSCKVRVNLSSFRNYYNSLVAVKLLQWAMGYWSHTPMYMLHFRKKKTYHLKIGSLKAPSQFLLQNLSVAIYQGVLCKCHCTMLISHCSHYNYFSNSGTWEVSCRWKLLSQYANIREC